MTFNVVIFIVQINCNWLQWSNIKVYKDILFIFFFTHLYIKKKLHSEKNSSYIHTNIIWHLYIWNRLYNFMVSKLFVFFVYLTVIRCGQTRIKPYIIPALCYVILNRFLFTDQRSLLMHVMHILQQVIV
jgi:hypothetical protein